ncbi:hypothetical protein [Herbiconiux liukaitaii]|uniref:hypothetical protein n=1 Tax=Herbiconiux liukaitaii TaxID=3342799 RepID=UPI0035B8A83E
MDETRFDLEAIAAEARTHVFAAVQRDRRRARRLSVLAGGLAVLVAFAGGIAIALPREGGGGRPPASEVVIAVETGDAAVLAVAATCEGVGSFEITLGEQPDPRRGSCSRPGEVRTLYFDLAGAGAGAGAGGRQVLSIGSDDVREGLTIATRLVPAAIPASTSSDSGAATGTDMASGSTQFSAPAGVDDLVAARGVDGAGAPVAGFVRWTDLLPPVDDQVGAARTRWLQEQREAFPEGRSIPLLAADGTTPIGTYLVTS